MYATVRHHDRATTPTDELVADGRRLASTVGRIPGFVAYVLLDAGEGLLISISVFEDEAGLADADRIVERWNAAPDREPSTSVSPVRTGEVIVQRGM
jgi:hypothetical protein